jgi:2-keto-4-pentenoate hydratase
MARALADELMTATRTRLAIAPLTLAHPDLTAADAYAIQRYVVGDRLDRGETIVGWKLGLTSIAMQAQLGVDQPDYGPILSGSRVASGASLEASAFIAPRVEAEVAVVLGRPLSGPVGRDDVVRAVDGVCAAIEIIDSRIADWKIRLADTIADLASSARVVVSDRVVAMEGFEPRLLGAVLARGDDVVATGAGAAAMGDPLAAVAWASATLGGFGVTMEAGAVIMTGALHASVPAKAGERFVAEFDRLGSLTIDFV